MFVESVGLIEELRKDDTPVVYLEESCRESRLELDGCARVWGGGGAV
jgi:hypothetical protein